jgi:hypothetical protein
MKPRIYKRNGIWHCRLPACDTRPLPHTGLGYSPRLAYLDWLKA